MSAQLLDAAAEIGAKLCREAHWHGNRCTWVGRALAECEPSAPPTVRSIGVDLYSGTAGVALFLAELWSATLESRVRKTALGALEQTRVGANRIPPHNRLGLYSGVLGIGLALIRCGDILGEPTFTATGGALIRGTCSASTGDEPLDLISGIAGAIQVLLSIDTPDGSDLLDIAVTLAERLIGNAQRDADSLAWPTARASGIHLGRQPLTGLSHGAAGMGLALLEIAARTGRSDLREAGEAAYRYEDKQFSSDHQNWPDLRRLDPVVPKERRSYGISWCHGAPGIGLARLRALHLFPGTEQWLHDATAALGVTRRHLCDLLTDPWTDSTLCHGIGGLLEFLLVASKRFEDVGLPSEIVEASRQLLSVHGANVTWPSGFASRGRSPSLMLGIAGVGHQLLRTARPDRVHSVLLVSRSEVTGEY